MLVRRTIPVLAAALVALAPMSVASAAKPSASSITLTKTAAAPVDVDGNGTDAGDTITYSFTLKNSGSKSLSSIVVSDGLLGSISCSPTSLAAGASATCAPVTYTITQPNMDAGTVGSTAFASATSSAGGGVNSASTTNTTLAAQPALSFSKTAGTVNDTDANGTDPGDTITYTFSLANAGNVTLSGLGVTDPKLGSVSCTPTTLAPGALASCAPATYTIAQADLDAGSVGSTATATGTAPKGATVSKTSSTTTPLVSSPKLSVSVSRPTPSDADNDSLLDMGDTQPYQYTVTNQGSSSLSGVTVQSSLSDAVSCPTGTLAGGASMTCTSSHVVTLAEVGAGTLTNTATASNGTVTSPAGSSAVTFDRMNIALQHGLPNLVSYAELVAKARDLRTGHVNLAAQLIPSTPMNWNTDDNGWSTGMPTSQTLQVILKSNYGSSVHNLALAGTAARGSARMGYTAVSPFAQPANSWAITSDPGMNEFTDNLVSWLLGGVNLSTSTAKVVLADMRSEEEPPARAWFAAHAPSITLNGLNSCNLPSNPSCINGADLLVVSGDGSGADAGTIAAQVRAAYDAGTPVLLFANSASNSVPPTLAGAFGFTVSSYANGLTNSTRAAQLPGGNDAFQQVVTPLVETTFGTPLATSDYNACQTTEESIYNCAVGSTAFHSYQAALETWRSWIRGANNAATSWFTQPRNNDQDLMRSLVMLADKLRTGAAPSTQSGDAVPAVTYPIPTFTDGAALTRALFTDATTMTAWSGNQAAANTGTLYCTRTNLLANSCTAPGWPGMGDHALTMKTTQNDEWQSTGLDAKPGVPVTVKLTSDPGVKVYVRSFFQRVGTTKSGEVDGSNRPYFDRPQFVATDWIPVTTTPTTFSTPYGGPLYIRIGGSTATRGTSVPLQFTNTATHPAVLDMTDDAQISAFVANIDNGAYYADLAGSGFEAHMAVERIKKSLNTNLSSERPFTYSTHGGLQQFLDDYRDQFVFGIYRTAGLQIGDQPLASTNDPDVVAACQNFGLPCLDPALNRRTQIQHVNYDQRANCGNLCSGNPIDSDGYPTPFGWGESHELGHNLQRKQLNVHWADTGASGSNAAAKNVWSNYSNQSGEVSNNIFPYNTAWRFFRNVHQGWGVAGEPTPDTGPLKRDVGGVDAFAIAQSIRSGQNSGGILRALDSNCVSHNTTDTTATPVNIALANAMWRPGSSTNPVQMSFYQQIPAMLRGKALADGTTLRDGFGIWTLLYQAARGWSDATSSSAKWTAAAQATYGMTDFAWTNDAVYGAGNDVNDMIGNDFLLIQLSKMTGYDWRPYFQLHGVLYTDLANQQVTDNTPAGGYKSFNNVYQALGQQLPFADFSNIGAVDMTSPATAWPGAFDSSPTSKSKVGFHPSSCP